LLASDFDRTLTNTQDQVVPKNLEAVDRFMAEGGAFTVCTGRSHLMFRDKAALVRANAPFILSNGALSYGYRTGRPSFTHPLPESCRRAAADVMARFPHTRVELQCLTGHYVFGEDAERDRFMRYAHVYPKHVPLDEIEGEIYKIAIIGSVVRRENGQIDIFAECSPEENAGYQAIMDFVAGQDYGGEYEIIRTAPRIVELQRKGVTKGAAARELAGRMGRSMLVCTGDAPNDIPMLREADMAVVPASAMPAVLAEGFTVGAHCDDGTVASAIEMLERMF